MHKLQVLDVASGYVSTLAEADRLSSVYKTSATSQRTRPNKPPRALSTVNIGKNPQHALDAYQSLFALRRSLGSLQSAAEGAAPHLVDQVSHTLQESREALKQIFAAQLDKTVEKVLWPKRGVPLPESLVPEFHAVCVRLLSMQQPELDQDISSADALPVLLPLELLGKPLCQSFEYHFSGIRPTNRPDKPEYFLNHFVETLEAHHDFILDHVQPVLIKYFHGTQFARELSCVDATTTFISALLPALRTKLRSLVRLVRDQPKLLSHLIHELQSFDTELKDDWRYDPTPASSAVSWKGVTHEVLAEGDLFAHWLSIEKDFALSRYAAIISDQAGAELDFDSVGASATKPTKHAIRVHDLLLAITDDYRALQSFGQKLRFLIDIQIAIFDQYHARLHSGLEAFISLTSSLGRTVQGASPEELASLEGVKGLERLCRIFGSCDYLERAMRDWSDDVFFLDLWTELQTRAQDGGRVTRDMSVQEVAKHTSASLATTGDDSDTLPASSGALFDETAAAYGSLRDRSERILVERLSAMLQEALRPYGRTANTWTYAHIPESEPGPSTPSASLTQPLGVLQASFDLLRRALARLPFRRVSQALSKIIDAFLWDRVILGNTFTLHGARQLDSDVSDLETILGPSGGSLPRARDAVTLLALVDKSVDADTLALADVDRRLFANNESAREVLDTLGIALLSENDARKVLRNRSEVGTS